MDSIGVEVFERAPGVHGEATVVDPQIVLGIGFQLVESSSENPAAATRIAAGEMVEADGNLDKALIEEFVLSVGLPPEIFPGFVGLEIASTIKIFIPFSIASIMAPFSLIGSFCAVSAEHPLPG